MSFSVGNHRLYIPLSHGCVGPLILYRAVYIDYLDYFMLLAYIIAYHFCIVV